MAEQLHDVRLHVNGVAHDVAVPARRLLSDALRHDIGLTGTHVGCEHGVCGACTVLVDGRPMRSCLMFAVSAVDTEITTVEGLTNADGSLGPVQQAFAECHGLQCGFCTPGFLTTITAGLEDNPKPTRDAARDMVAGNLCRCTGYQNIVKAVLRAAEIRRGAKPRARRRGLDTAVGGRAAARNERRVETGSTTDQSGQLPYEERDDDNASTGLGA
jgi:carbon-monoxide dehydrogenase small subunit